jgi:glutathione S-transferase
MSSAPELVLYQFAPALGLPISESPPCAKVEVYCRLMGIPYSLGPGDIRKSPNGLVPFVRHPDGSLQAESGDILRRLEEERDPAKRLDAGLDPEALATAHALAARVEGIGYEACLFDRFADPAGWAHQKPITLALIRRFLPRSIAPVVLPFVRWKQVIRARRAGMRDVAAGHAASVEALRAVSERLEASPFLAGDTPSTADCGAWPNVLHIAATPNSSPPREAARRDDRLAAWVERVAERGGCKLPPSWRR